MVERKRVGLIFSYSEEWIASSYYILNLIQALATLDDQNMPQLVIFSSSEKEFDLVRELQYPHIEYKLLPSTGRIDNLVNKISRRLFKKHLAKVPLGSKVDVLFPSLLLHSGQHKDILWIPDFQERYLTNFFSARELSSRAAYKDLLASSGAAIVFSSRDSHKDFKLFYPKNHSRTYVLPFAVSHPDHTGLSIGELWKKFNINRPYFFAPNQFWIHKDQSTILKAVKTAVKENPEILVVFSGKEKDYRMPGYFESLQSFVQDNDLQDHIRFLGFIDRKEQLCLMNHAIAVIQASLFEGWSTVVEDAKALGQYLVTSDLPVHNEQLNQNVTFFKPKMHEELAGHLVKLYSVKPEKLKNNYSDKIREFGKHFMEIVKEECAHRN